MRYRTSLGLLAALLQSTMASAQSFSSPDDLLRTLLDDYLFRGPITNFEPYISERLSEELQGARIDAASLKKLGFDPLAGSAAQNAGLITVFDLTSAYEGEFTAESVATFLNNGEPVSITFGLVLENKHGWQIDHISGTAGELQWCTNDILAAALSSASDAN